MLESDLSMFIQTANRPSTIIHSALFGSERKYRAILRANTIKKHLGKDANRKKEKDIEDELQEIKSSDTQFKSSESMITSASIFFEDISTCFQSTPCSLAKYVPKNNFSNHKIIDDIEVGSSNFSSESNDISNTKDIEQWQEASTQNNNSGNTTKTFVDSENYSLRKNAEVSYAYIDQKSILSVCEKINTLNNSKKKFMKNRKHQEIEDKFDDPLEFFNNILMNMLVSILEESIQNFRKAEKILKNINENKYLTEKYIRFCHSQNSLNENYKLRKLVDEYITLIGTESRQENETNEFRFNDLVVLTRNNILKQWIVNHEGRLIKSASNEFLLLIINIDYFEIKSEKGNINNKSKKEVLNVIEAFLQLWWRLEVRNSRFVPKGFAKYVKHIKICVTREDQCDRCNSERLLSPTRHGGKSLRRRFSMSSRNTTIHQALLEFLRSRNYILGNVSEDEIEVMGKN